MLEACYNNTMPDFEPHTLSITVADVPGVLNHVRAAALLAVLSGPPLAPACGGLYTVRIQAKASYRACTTCAQADVCQAVSGQLCKGAEAYCVPQVTAVFARRGYNVQSLAVGPSEAPGCSRIVMVVPGGPSGTENIQRQLLKLIYVQKVSCLCSVQSCTE